MQKRFSEGEKLKIIAPLFVVMWNQFKAVSLSHTTAPVAIREQVHLPGPLCQQILARIQETFDLEEALVLSTCNRTEIYYVSETDLSEDLIKLLAIEKGMPDPSRLVPYFRVINDHTTAALNLFEVSMGLQSKVIGDLQISNQVKLAYRYCADQKLAGPFLHRILHTIFHTHKRVHQETNYRDGAASVSYASAELANELMSNWEAPSVLVLGLGEMGSDVARNLVGSHFSRIAIANRTREKADAIGLETGAEVLDWEAWRAQATDFDVIISSVSASEPVLTRADFPAQPELLKTKYLIDLSVPRSIAPDLENFDGLVVFNIDEIQLRTSEVVEKRKQSIPKVKKIIAQEMKGLGDWSKELSISPTIHKLKDALEQIRQEELTRYLKNADEKESELVDKVTKSMMNKIMKLPVLQLKAACKRGEEETLIDLLNDLFNLERQPVREPKK